MFAHSCWCSMLVWILITIYTDFWALQQCFPNLVIKKKSKSEFFHYFTHTFSLFEVHNNAWEKNVFKKISLNEAEIIAK